MSSSPRNPARLSIPIFHIDFFSCFMICPVAFIGVLKSWNPAVPYEEVRLKHSFIHSFISPVIYLLPLSSLSLYPPSEGQWVMEAAGLWESEREEA